MDSLSDLLAQKDFDEPPELAAIKDYVREKFQAEVTVSSRGQDIIIEAPSAALIGRLRYDLPELKAATGVKQRVGLRIC